MRGVRGWNAGICGELTHPSYFHLSLRRRGNAFAGVGVWLGACFAAGRGGGVGGEEGQVGSPLVSERA